MRQTERRYKETDYNKEREMALIRKKGKKRRHLGKTDSWKGKVAVFWERERETYRHTYRQTYENDTERSLKNGVFFLFVACLCKRHTSTRIVTVMIRETDWLQQKETDSPLWHPAASRGVYIPAVSGRVKGKIHEEEEEGLKRKKTSFKEHIILMENHNPANPLIFTFPVCIYI